MPAPPCPPDRYVALVVDGPDAASFLQGQLTQDVAQAPADPLAIGALLTPQGRVLATPWIAFAGPRRTLLVPAALGATLLEHLRRFVLRAKVTLALGAPDAALLATLQSAVGQRLGGADAPDWALALVRAGLPEVDATTSGEWIPQMLNLDLVGGISFRKGCYTGQEIVARTQHLGRIKRRMRRLTAPGAPPAPGTALSAAAAKVGEVVLAGVAGADCEFLAVIGLDAPVAGLQLADGREAVRASLPYAVD